MSVLNKTGIYIAYPTTSVLKPIYIGYKTMVNDEHIKVGITIDSFASRQYQYHKTFGGEIFFQPIAIFNGDTLTDLHIIEKRMHSYLSMNFKRRGRAREWYETKELDKVLDHLREYFKNHPMIDFLHQKE